MGYFEDGCNTVIMLLSLVENLFTTYYFDEDKFGVVPLVLVFCFEPILDSIVKQLMNCTECDWDNFLYDLISEGIQCFLFIHFCDYSDISKLILPLLMAGQVLIMIVCKIKEKVCEEKTEEKTEKQKEDEYKVNCAIWFHSNLTTLVLGLLPLFYLAYQEVAPYRQKPFEMILTGYYWSKEVEVQLYLEAAREVAVGGDSMKLRDSMRLQMAHISWTLKFTRLCKLAFFVYIHVLAWMYWFSPDIEEVFDKVFTMITMISSPCILCSVPLELFRMMCGDQVQV